VRLVVPLSHMKNNIFFDEAILFYRSMLFLSARQAPRGGQRATVAIDARRDNCGRGDEAIGAQIARLQESGRHAGEEFVASNRRLQLLFRL